MSLRWRLFIVFLAVALVPLAAVSWDEYTSVEAELENRVLIEESLRLQKERERIALLLEKYQSVVVLASQYPPIQGIIRSEETGVDPVDASTLAQWRSRLEEIYFDVLVNNDDLFQVRYINEEGMEVVRVHVRNQEVFVVDEEELQNKSETVYFTETMNKKNGEVYVSDVDLNREWGKIVEPYQQVIRLAVPIFSQQDGERKGLVIINVNAGKLFAFGNQKIVLVDSLGQYLVTDDQGKFMGSILGKDVNFFADYPGVYFDGARELYRGYHEPRSEFLTGIPILYSEASEKEWILFSVVDREILLSPIVALRDRILVVAGLSLLLVMALSWWSARYMTRPILDLNKVAEDLKKGNYSVRSKISSRDEIGELADTFNEMAAELEEYRDNMESRVEKQTSGYQKAMNDLEARNVTLDQTKRAMLNLMEDLEEQKQMLQTQLQETLKFEQAVESSTDAIVITDSRAHILYVNPAWSALNGYSSSEALGKSTSIVRSTSTNKDLYTEMWETILSGHSFITEDVVNRRKDGSMYHAQLSIYPIIGDDEQIIYFVGVLQDISLRKEIDRAKSEFVSLASHQLRTPLSAINWYTEMLLDGDVGEIEGEQRKYLEQVKTSNERMVELVNALLNVSRIELGTMMIDPVELDVAEAADAEIEELRSQFEAKHLNLNKAYDEDLPTLMADKNLMRIILQNLLTNSVKYTPEGGTISLRIGVSRDTNEMLISVSDTGMGIPASGKDKIFTKLFRADNVKESDTDGTGLGMYLVKSIVDEVGGRIWFESEEGRGTTFYVTLPLSGMERRDGSRTLE